MRAICAWCGADLGERPGPEGMLTHGICAPCLDATDPATHNVPCPCPQCPPEHPHSCGCDDCASWTAFVVSLEPAGSAPAMEERR